MAFWRSVFRALVRQGGDLKRIADALERAYPPVEQTGERTLTIVRPNRERLVLAQKIERELRAQGLDESEIARRRDQALRGDKARAAGIR